MAASKSHWVTVLEGVKTILNKQFFNIADAKKFQKEKKEEYSDKKYSVLLESY